MSISGIHSGMQIIQQSYQQMEKASEDVQSLSSDPLQTQSLDSLPEKPAEAKPNQIDTVIAMNQAQSYNRAGVNIVQRSNEMIGTLLDVQV
ncbi:hypothetical protein [Vibrio maerlii]|uniref:hypothetical protein n=1 Tax=Vibrio maerlii TaxID=2231648 RepID=UPI000E3DCDA2|nr:hypothetical protein [Vibrio maerlii]